MSVAVKRTWVEPYVRGGHPVAGYWRDPIEAATEAVDRLHFPQEFLTTAQTLVDRGVIPSTHGYQPSSLAEREIYHGMDTIASVHKIKLDGEMPPKLPVVSRDEPDGLDGEYRYSLLGGLTTPTYMRVATVPANPDFTVAHEFGHYLDQQIFGKRRNFGSRQALDLDGYRDGADHPLRGVMTAISDSKAMRRMLELADSNDPVYLPDPESGLPYATTYQDDTIHKATLYYLEPDEAFARAYSQYVAHKSGSQPMLAIVAKRALDAQALHPQQWTEEDFAPIAAAFDDLFAKLGWRETVPPKLRQRAEDKIEIVRYDVHHLGWPKWRVPVLYEQETGKVYVGEPGTAHEDLLRAMGKPVPDVMWSGAMVAQGYYSAALLQENQGQFAAGVYVDQVLPDEVRNAFRNAFKLPVIGDPSKTKALKALREEHVSGYLREGHPVKPYIRHVEFVESVREILGIPKTGKLRTQIEPGIQGLDRVFRMPDLPKIRLRATAGKSNRGGYNRADALDEAGHHIAVPNEIRISASPDDAVDSPALTLTHEMGHYLDNQGFRRQGVDPTNADGTWFESIAAYEYVRLAARMRDQGIPLYVKKPPLADWYEAVRQTHSFAELSTCTYEEIGTHSYLLNPKELWARCVAQYVATRSGQPDLLKALRSWQNMPKTQDVALQIGDSEVPFQAPTPTAWLFHQWSDDDFAPVAAEMDKIFKERGWLR